MDAARRAGAVSWAVTGLAVLALGAAWMGLAPRPALAQVPDSGAQRDRMIAELKAMNGKLDTMIKLLAELRDQGAKEKQEKPAGE